MHPITSPCAAPQAGAGGSQRVTPRRVGSGIWRRSGDLLSRAKLATIVEYTDQEPPQNDYPHRIVSPVLPAACCASNMVDIGDPETDGQLVFQYRRCPTCGFTVRRILAKILAPLLVAKLRKTLKSAFVREPR
jgi:hypothetical protein